MRSNHRPPPGLLLDCLKAHLGLRNDGVLARLLSLHPSTISRIRAGQVEVSPAVLLRMHERSGIHPALLRQFCRDTPALAAVAPAATTHPDAAPARIPTPVNGNGVAALRPWQILCLREEQMRALGAWSDRLTPEHMALLTAPQLQALIAPGQAYDGDQINAIAPEVLAALPVATLATLGRGLAQLSFTMLDNGAVDWHYLRPEQVCALTPAQLGALADRGPMSMAAMTALRADQAAALSAEFLQLISYAMMEALSHSAWQGLSHEQLKAAWGSSAPWTADRVAALTPAQIAALTAGEALALGQRCQWLAPAQLDALTPRQWRIIGHNLAADPQSPWRQLGARQLAGMSPAGRAKLPPMEIPASMSPSQVAALSPLWLASLRPDQVGTLSLSYTGRGKLDWNQLVALDPDQRAALEPAAPSDAPAPAAKDRFPLGGG